MDMRKTSCHGCAERHIGCHATCDKYAKDVLRRHDEKEAYKARFDEFQRYQGEREIRYQKTGRRYVV